MRDGSESRISCHRRPPPFLDGQQRDYVVHITRSAKRLENLLNDLLDFARFEAGSFRLNLQETDFCVAIQEVIGRHEAAILRPRQGGKRMNGANREKPLYFRIGAC